MSRKFCEVAFPIPVHREFTYEIPEELADSVALGVRVVAPFRKRFVTGVVVGLSTETNLKEVKAIRDVVDSSPIYSPTAMKLTRWISDYYLRSWGEALKAAGPAGTSVESSQVVRLVDEAKDEKNEMRRSIMEALASEGTMTVKQL